MKSRESLIRLQRFQVNEKRRQVVDIETMIADFERMAAELDQQILAEQERTGIEDVSHFAYSTFAKAAAQRRDNLKESAAELEGKLNAAQEELATAFEELKKVEMLEAKEAEKARVAELALEQSELDEVALRGSTVSSM